MDNIPKNKGIDLSIDGVYHNINISNVEVMERIILDILIITHKQGFCIFNFF